MIRRLTRTTGLLLVLGALFVPPTSAQHRSPDLTVQYHRAETAFRSGASMLEAKARVDRVLDAVPNDVDALKLRARVLLKLGRHDEALRDAQQAVDAHPKDAEAHLIFCEAARLSGNRVLAEEALARAAELVFDDAAQHVSLSWNAQQLGLHDKAEAFARTALALNRTESAAYYQLARVFMDQDRPDDAAAVLRQGFEDDLLDATMVRADAHLAPLTQHPDVQAYLAN